MLRRLAFATGLIFATVLLVLGFAWPGAETPWSARRTHALPLAEFASNTSQIALTETTLRAEGADANGATRLTQALPGLPAADFRYFAFDVDEWERVAKLTLTWQGSEGAGSAALPEAPLGRATLDLARVPAWKGTIESIALIQSPTDYLAAAVAPDAPLLLREARLESSNWRAALGALWTQWVAYRPWTGRSNNTGGLELGTAGPSLQAFLAAWVVAALLIVAVCLGRTRARSVALPIVLAAGLVLALWQMRQLAARAAVADTAAALATDESPLAAQPQLAAAALRVSERFAQEDSPRRVLVFGPDRFLSEYPTWLLRAQNVATLPTPEQLPPQAELSDTVLVLVGAGDWEYSPDARRLRIGSQERSASLDFNAGVMKAYRFEAAP